MRPITVFFVALQIITLLWGSTIALGRTTDSDPVHPPLSFPASKLFKVLSVLENNIPDRPMLEKVRDKLFTLSDRQTVLITSLADQVVRQRNTANGDIAFLLMTALIILL